ncbi:XRE family transcriptional regulator [Bosea sp. 117]|uniref:helix-turn-helix domain-containing protein n=1 Tax=Bosea sp. 117 TaxID=1125973 RepID=UPI00069155D9|nr:XRE family transcriptional regulator [Bosea sp. 117]
MNTARSLTADIHGGDTGPRDIVRALSEYRLRRRMTLQDVANLTGVSVGTLSKLENDKATPSFGTLTRIMRHIDLSADLPLRPAAPAASARKAVTREENVITATTDRAIMSIHAAELMSKQMFPMVAQITLHETPPVEEWTRHAGDEFVYVLSGEVEVHVEPYRPFVLRSGQSAYYDSGMRHVIVSRGSEDAVVLSVSTSPASADITAPDPR